MYENLGHYIAVQSLVINHKKRLREENESRIQKEENRLYDIWMEKINKSEEIVKEINLILSKSENLQKCCNDPICGKIVFTDNNSLKGFRIELDGEVVPMVYCSDNVSKVERVLFFIKKVIFVE